MRWCCCQVHDYAAAMCSAKIVIVTVTSLFVVATVTKFTFCCVGFFEQLFTSQVRALGWIPLNELCVGRYMEAALCGALLISDVPCEMSEQFRNFMVWKAASHNHQLTSLIRWRSNEVIRMSSC